MSKEMATATVAYLACPTCGQAPCQTPGFCRYSADEDRKRAPPGPRILSSREFVAGFVPPDYLVHGLIQEGFLYSLTGATGSGKTSVTLRMAASIALGKDFAGKKTKRRRVLYLAAENPDDVRMRWIALAQQMDFLIDKIEVYFIEGVFRISEMTERIKTEIGRLGGEFGLVVVDTGPVFYEGDDENNRTQQGRHAELLRGLIGLVPGKPAVIANCHPTKNAAADNLIPAGGGNFLNSIDGNLTAAKSDSTIEIHWQGKYRGVEFAPLHFMLKTVTHQDLKDSAGGLIPTVICEHINERAKEQVAEQRFRDENKMLAIIDQHRKATIETLAFKMGWKLHSGEANKAKAYRCVEALKKAKLLTVTRAGKFQLSAEGKKALDENDIGTDM
jgi:hypothetical protein